MKKTSEMQALDQVLARRKRLAAKIVRKRQRPVGWVGGKLYFLDGARTRVPRTPLLPKPGRKAVGWEHQLPKDAARTIAKATKAEMVAVVVETKVVPAPKPAAEPLSFTMERKLQALRELAAKGIDEAREALLRTRQLYSEA
ncbi:MAG: hypothetical protein RL681_252 [Candidatus Parcubacteria bacterium]|jgi:hypothetical protein